MVDKEIIVIKLVDGTERRVGMDNIRFIYVGSGFYRIVHNRLNSSNQELVEEIKNEFVLSVKYLRGIK